MNKKRMLKFFVIITAVLLCSYQLQRILDRRMSSQTPEQKLEALGYAFNGNFSILYLFFSDYFF